MAQQRGLYCSIDDETLRPPEHLEQALQVNLNESISSVQRPRSATVSAPSGPEWSTGGASWRPCPTILASPSTRACSNAWIRSTTYWTAGKPGLPPPCKPSPSLATARTPGGRFGTMSCSPIARALTPPQPPSPTSSPNRTASLPRSWPSPEPRRWRTVTCCERRWARKCPRASGSPT